MPITNRARLPWGLLLALLAGVSGAAPASATPAAAPQGNAIRAG